MRQSLTTHALLLGALTLVACSGAGSHRASDQTGVAAVAAATPASLATTTSRWCELLPRPVFGDAEPIATPDHWFVVSRIEPGVFSLQEPNQFQEATSWLIVGGERALLFDTGLGMRPIRPVVRALTSLPVTVLNSHTHYDHVGGNAEFDSILAVDSAYTRANTRGFAHAEVAGEVAPDAFCGAPPAGLDTSAFHTRPWTATGTVHDGQLIDLGGRTLEVLQVPGHTPDALALLDRSAGLLWTGDSFYEGAIWLYVPETDLDAYARSADRLAALAPTLRRLLPAHNAPGSDPKLLLRVPQALRDARAGRAQGTEQNSDRTYFPFDGFGLLISKPALAHRAPRAEGGGSGLTMWPPDRVDKDGNAPH